jgi:hypothetical protein
MVSEARTPVVDRLGVLALEWPMALVASMAQVVAAATVADAVGRCRCEVR